LVKPVALRILNISAKDSVKYFKEVEDKLMEETNYLLEIKQSIEVSEACKNIPNLLFPQYYTEYSTERIITMDWMTGKHLSEYTPTLASGKKLGQALWDFYMHQMHVLRKVHADPHPGNFLVSEDEKLIALDFGCMKTIPLDFYTPYFELIQKETLEKRELFIAKMQELEIVKTSDTEEEIEFFSSMFHELLSWFAKPFHTETFDFSDSEFFDKIAQLSEQYTKNTELRKMDANRGSKHFIYVNRTFFGLYSLMNMLQANDIKIKNYQNL